MGMGAPFVSIQERDLSDRAPAAAGVYGGIVIPATRGAINVPTLVTSQADMLNTFTADGKVHVGDDLAYYSALAFLAQSNKLWVVRAADPVTAYYALGGVAQAGALVPFTTLALGTVVDPTAFTFTAEAIALAAKNQGAWGNGVYVRTIPYFTAADVNNPQPGTEDPFNVGEPGAFRIDVHQPASVVATTAWAATTAYTPSSAVIPAVANGFYYVPTSAGTSGAAAPVFPLVAGATVVDGTVTWTAFPLVSGQPEESWVVSRDSAALNGSGRSMFIDNILQGSNLITGVTNVAVANTILPAYMPAAMPLGSGANGLAVTDGMMMTAVQKLNDTIQYTLTVLMDGGRTTAAYQKEMVAVCEARNDCVAILSMPFDSESPANYMATTIGYRKGTGAYTTATTKTELNANTSFAALYAGSLKIYDRFNDRELIVSPDGYVAAAVAKTGRKYELWAAVAGDRRGVLNVLDVYRRYTAGEMDLLYDAGINPIVNIPGRGIQIFGQKTLQTRPSDTDRLNVRMMLITIEPAIRTALYSFLFEVNDSDTRGRIRTLLESYMSDIKARRGVFDFKVICDSSNNGPAVINSNRLNAYVLVKASKTVEFIRATVGITPRGVSFTTANNQL